MRRGPAIVAATRELLERIFKPGFVYHEAGVFLTDIMADIERQQILLPRIDDKWRLRLMEALDRINRKHGRYTVDQLAAGCDRVWEMKRRALSHRHTTRLDEVLWVKV
ncbi:MAG TPA: DUF4113 domain-containing protein [Pyrinomonadaceae bacterium]|nr:DUF4113 domain-containing protein [Pyrinomonadaceae bacterium]